MFFPISDDDRELVKPAVVTWVLVALNVLVFLYQLANPGFTAGYAGVPAELTSGRDLVGEVAIPLETGEVIRVPHAPGPPLIWLTLLTSMFMHAGFMHLGGNLLFLWIFGDNVEHRFGHVRFLGFYLVSGLVASAAQIATGPDSIIPTLGASGAISGVLGAYLVLFPHNRVNAIVFFSVVSVPAFLVIVMWAVLQFVNGFGAFAHTAETGGVAYAAHIGGFVAGLAMGAICRARMRSEPASVLTRAYHHDPRDQRWW